MRSAAFEKAVVDYVYWRAFKSRQPHWRAPQAVALGHYTINDAAMYFAGITFLRRDQRGVPLDPAEVPPRLAVFTLAESDAVKDWYQREIPRQADVAYDAATETVIAQNVRVRNPFAAGRGMTVEAQIPFGDVSVPGHLGDIALQISTVIPVA